MKLALRYVLVAACCAVTMSYLAFTSYAQSSRSEREISMDDDPLLHPLPPGIRVRAFIHRPRVVEPSHLGTCTPTIPPGDLVDWYDCAPWQLPSGGITLKLSESTMPANLNKVAARSAIQKAFETWNIAVSQTLFAGLTSTTVKSAKLDGTNAILWKKLRSGVIGETYIWYDQTTGEVLDADTVFNSGHPWGILDDAAGECSPEDKYDLQNIATHEFGHWIGLDDVIGPVDLTMYLFGSGGELKKRSLGLGDTLGANCIYNNICE